MKIAKSGVFSPQFLFNLITAEYFLDVTSSTETNKHNGFTIQRPASDKVRLGLFSFLYNTVYGFRRYSLFDSRGDGGRICGC